MNSNLWKEFPVGTKVRHDKYGVGEVTSHVLGAWYAIIVSFNGFPVTITNQDKDKLIVVSEGSTNEVVKALVKLWIEKYAVNEDIKELELELKSKREELAHLQMHIEELLK